MSDRINECPLCGRPFAKLSSDGKIGFCAFHDEWFPRDSAAAALASQANEQLKAEKRKQEQQQAEAVRKSQNLKKRKQQASVGAKIAAVVVVLAAIALAVFWFAVRPRLNYRDADALLAQGAYEQARGKFSALGGYSDSDAKVTLCDAFIALQDNDLTTALEKLDEIDAEGDGLSDGLKISICDTVANWQDHGISPEGLLALLARADDFDPNGTLDLETLSSQAHIAMLRDDSLLDLVLRDVNGDGEDNIVVLKDDYTVTAYQMQASGNAKITLDYALTATCLLDFGDRFAARDEAKAMACYQAAYAADPSADAAAKLGSACQARATASEAQEDYENALADAAYALEIMDTEEAYSFYFDMMLRRCYAEADSAEGIRLWDGFTRSTAAAAQKFAKEDEVRARSAELRLARAEELAAAKDPACLDLLREARDRGADISATLDKAIERADTALRVRLRQLAQEVCAEDSAALEAQTALLTADLEEALNGWQSLGIAPEEVFALLAVPETASAAVDAGEIYRQAALAAASAEGAPVAHVFFDWDGDGTEELLTLSDEGALRAYELKNGKLASAWSDAVAFPAGRLTALDNRVILCEAADETGFAVYVYGDGALQKRVSAANLREYARADGTIECGLLLDGSIERYLRYRYDLVTAPDDVELVALDWQQDDYPLPDTAEAAVVRYFEALCYESQDEAALLTAAAPYADGAYPEGFAAAPRPDDVNIAANAYEADKDNALFEVSYPASGATQRLYVAAVRDGSWKVAGIADRFTAANVVTPETLGGQLIALNDAVTDKLADASDKRIYRVLLSGRTEARLVWQAGDKDNDRESFQVGVYRASDLENPIASYTYGLARKKQAENPLFLTPGVYYIAVFPVHYQDCDFTLTLEAERSEYLEAEPNDSLAQATPIALNQDYAAGLSAKTDIDLFSFTLSESSAVRVVLSADAGTGRQTRYAFALADRATAQALTQASLDGQEKEIASEAVYLAPGEYVVQVQKGDAWWGGEYHVRIEAETAANSEIEGNDTPETATPIAVNEEYAGTIAKEGDVDHFAFTLESDAIIQPRFTFDALESGAKTYVLTVQQDGRNIVSYSVGGKETQKTFTPYPLKAGSYTIKVENPRFAAQGYRLTVVCQAMPQVEQEPNDALAQASALESGAPVSGLLFNGDDVDTYRISLAEDSILALNFEFAPAAASGNAYILSLEQNGKSVSKWNAAAQTGGVSGSVQLPAGEYELVLSAGDAWTGAIYTLTAASSPVAALDFGAEVAGSLPEAGDVAALRFTLREYTEVVPDLNVREGSVALRLIKTGEKNAVQSFTRAAGDAPARSVWRLAPGEYFLHLTAAGGPAEYAFTLAPHAGQAVEYGREYSGALQGVDDADSYALAFTEATTVTLRLTFAEIPSADEAFRLSLDQGLAEVWSAPVAGNLGVYEVTMKIPTGEYLLHVTCAERMAGSAYTLTISK